MRPCWKTPLSVDAIIWGKQIGFADHSGRAGNGVVVSDSTRGMDVCLRLLYVCIVAALGLAHPLSK
jgi:hypothetical protein